MEAIRLIKKPINNKITINVPDSFSDREVEIIALPLEKKKGKLKFNSKGYLGFMKNIDMDVEQEIKKLRNEWERNF